MSTEGAPSAAGRSWMYQWRRPLAGAAVALLLYTLAGFFLVPRILRSQLETFARETLDRELRLEDVRFNPFTLTATLGGLLLADRDAADLVRVQRVVANLELSGIFRRAVRFARIHIDRPSVSARILPDGRPSVSDLLEPDGQASDGPFELPRLIIDQLLITGGQLSFADASRQPVYEAQFAPLELDVKHLVTIPEEGGEHAITIGVGETARLRWTGRQVVEPLRFTGRLDITGLALPPLWDYFGRDERLRLRAGTVDLALPYEIRRGSGVPFELTLREATARVNDLAVRPSDEEEDWLTAARSEASGIEAAWPAARLQIARVSIDRPAVLARVEEDGRLNWQHALPASSEAPADNARPWDVTIATFELQEGRASLHAVTDAERRMLTLADTRVRAAGIRTAADAPVTFTAGARVQERGQLDLSGTVTPSPLAFDVAFGAEAIDLAPLAPYLASVTRASLAGGTASLKGTAAMTATAAPAGAAASAGTKPALRVAAGGAIENVALHDTSGERLIAWSRMAIDGFTLEDPPHRARIRTVTVDRPYAKLVIDEDGRLNLTTALAPPEGSAAAGPDERAGEPERSASNSVAASPTLEIGTVRLRDASAEFADLSLLREFRAQIHSAEGTIRDLSSFAAAPATIAIEGRVDKTGFVKVGGTLRTSDPLAASEVTLGFRDIEMPRLTPYVAEFAGYAVQSGALDLDVRYTVKARRLVGTHSIVARDLVLGERVKDSKAPGLAVRLAVALLKDRQGRINLDVPVEGSVDAPEFNYRAVFWSAMRTILGNAAKAPFRALGRLFGRDEEDLELVEFDAGRSDLLPADASTLGRLAEQLTARPELTILVEGRFDPKADPPAIRRAKLDALIEARRPAATAAAAPGASALETILEGLFVETFSADALAAERARFTPAAAPAGTEAAAPSGAAAPAVPPPPTDAAAFYEALRARLLEAQPVGEGDLQALASARSAAIRDALTQGGAIEAARIRLAAPASVKRSKANSSRIASEMTMTAGDAEGA